MEKSVKNLNSKLFSALPIFAAVVRLGSFTRAAEEMDLTQSAVSRRIQSLEDHLGIALFARSGRNIKITADGALFNDAVNKALLLIENSRTSFGSPLSGVIRIGALPSISALWLIPKLASFKQANPDIVLSISTIDADFRDAHKDPVNWDPTRLDLVITWGYGGWRSLVKKPLIAEKLQAVISPSFQKQHNIKTPEDLWLATRLVHTTRQDTWQDAPYFSQENAQRKPHNFIELEHFFMLKEAAIAGVGSAILPELFIEEDVNTNKLIRCGNSWQTGGKYYLVGNQSSFERPVVQHFSEWLIKQCQTDLAAL